MSTSPRVSIRSARAAVLCAVVQLWPVAAHARQITLRSATARPETVDTSSSPRKRELPAFVYDAKTDQLLLFGGILSQADRRTFAWRENRWSVLSQEGPYHRDDMAFASMGELGGFVFFGGHSEMRDSARNMRQRVFRETWQLVGARWELRDSTGPEARTHPGSAFDPIRRRLVMFGGTLGVSNFGEPRRPFATDTWEWDGSRWHRLDVSGPAGRMGFSMAYDATSRMVLLHGGVRDNIALTDTWGWDGAQWKLLAVDGPKSVYGAAASGPDSGVVLFGGHRLKESSVSTTWFWNGKSWRAVNEKGPSPRTFHAMATDTRRRRVYLIGGGNDFWYMDAGFAWTPLDSLR